MREATESYGTRDAWLKGRMGGIGASEAAIVLGESPWSSRLTLWSEKTGLVEREDGVEERVSWGSRLERAIIDGYCDETKRSTVPLKLQIWRHPTEPMLATPDALTWRTVDASDDDPGVLEVKNLDAFYWRGDVPRHYWIQVQHQMACTGATWGSFAALVGGNRLYWQDIERDEAFIEELTAECRRFWACVVEGQPPEAETEACKATLRKMFPNDNGETIHLPPEAQELDEVILGCEAQIEVHEKMQARAQARLMQLMERAQVGKLPDGVEWIWKDTKAGRRLRRAVRL